MSSEAESHRREAKIAGLSFQPFPLRSCAGDDSMELRVPSARQRQRGDESIEALVRIQSTSSDSLDAFMRSRLAARRARGQRQHIRNDVNSGGCNTTADGAFPGGEGIDH
jgi:hypothetical protein